MFVFVSLTSLKLPCVAFEGPIHHLQTNQHLRLIFTNMPDQVEMIACSVNGRAPLH